MNLQRIHFGIIRSSQAKANDKLPAGHINIKGLVDSDIFSTGLSEDIKVFQNPLPVDVNVE